MTGQWKRSECVLLTLLTFKAGLGSRMLASESQPFTKSARSLNLTEYGNPSF